MRKSAYDVVSAALEELEKLKPTPQEIQDYADLNQDAHGVVTYSKSKGGDYYFLRLHDTWKQKVGGRVHIDIGYVDEKRFVPQARIKGIDFIWDFLLVKQFSDKEIP